jgi:hypothetical protein
MSQVVRMEDMAYRITLPAAYNVCFMPTPEWSRQRTSPSLGQHFVNTDCFTAGGQDGGDGIQRELPATDDTLFACLGVKMESVA